MTNADRIRNMTDEELAERNVYATYEYDLDYDYDDNPISIYNDVWATSDNFIFYFREDAIEHELWWLQQPVDLEQKYEA